MNPVCDRPECMDKKRFIGGYPDTGHYDDDLNWQPHHFDETNHPVAAERMRMTDDRKAKDPEHAKQHGITLYHGTTKGNAEDIAKSGFHLDNTSNGRHSGEGIYLTPSHEEAKTYGTHVVEAKVGSSPALLHDDPWMSEETHGVPVHEVHKVLGAQGYHGHIDPDDNAHVIYNPAHVHPVAVHGPDGVRHEAMLLNENSDLRGDEWYASQVEHMSPNPLLGHIYDAGYSLRQGGEPCSICGDSEEQHLDKSQIKSFTKKKKGLPKTQKCSYCKEQATKRLLWAEGMAYIPVCDEHEDKGRHKIEVENNDEVVGIKTIGVKTDPCTCCQGTGEHDTGRECYGCDGSGQATGYDGSMPCDGTKPYGTDNEGHQVELDPMDGWQHLDGSISHDDGTTITDHPVKTARVHHPEVGPDGEDADGIMIALVPPKWVIKALPLPEDGEHPSNIHITLLYLGKVSEFTKEQVEYLPELIESWAETQKSLSAALQGVGTFANPGSHVLWAAADIPGGNHMWVSLADTLKGHGYAFKENHGWTPHLTMSYEKHNVRFLPKIERMEFKVREVWCCIGGRWESYPLTG